MKREYPLFVIDTSRAHGRGKEVDYICCTDAECGFTASVELFYEDEYKKMYDREDYSSLWSDIHNGVRTRVKIISRVPDNTDRTKSLLRKAMKELNIRKSLIKINNEEVTDENIVEFAEIFIKQIMENVRTKGLNYSDAAAISILNKIKDDYSK